MKAGVQNVLDNPDQKLWSHQQPMDLLVESVQYLPIHVQSCWKDKTLNAESSKQRFERALLFV